MAILAQILDFLVVVVSCVVVEVVITSMVVVVVVVLVIVVVVVVVEVVEVVENNRQPSPNSQRQPINIEKNPRCSRHLHNNSVWPPLFWNFRQFDMI